MSCTREKSNLNALIQRGVQKLKKTHTSVRDKAVKNQSFVLQCLMSTIGTGKIPYLQNFANLDGIDGFFDYFQGIYK